MQPEQNQKQENEAIESNVANETVDNIDTPAETHAEESKDNEGQSEKKAKDLKREPGQSHLHRFKAWYLQRKKWTIPASVILLVVLLGAVPWSRYHAAGVVLKKDTNFKITDSTAHTPVSGALVSIGGIAGTTDGSGNVTLHGVSVGNHTVLITKKYYEDKKAAVLVPIGSQKQVPNITFVATGRQVKVTVQDLISGKKIENASLQVLGISAKTDKNGEAVIVVPPAATSAQVKLSADGFNDSTATIQVSDSSIKTNIVKLTPAGKVYFLSKLSGKIDVVKTNLDGTGRSTVISGTGKEDTRNTVLLASRDWKYLALLTKRDDNPAKLYLIDTSNDQMTLMDGGNNSYTLVGWSGDNFVYTLSKNDSQPWQAHTQVLKSYNAQAKQGLILDQTNAQGTNSFDYATELYGQVYAIGKTVVYEKNWSAYYGNQSVLNDKQGGIYTINAGGSNPVKLKSFGYQDTQQTYVNSIPYEADEIYYQIQEKDATSYWAYSNGKLTQRNDIADEINNYYNDTPATYLLSPSGSSTFWAEPRDGKNTLFIGDGGGQNGKQIATLSDYTNYGWFTDNYLLVSKNSSELYITDQAGMQAGTAPIKITDYHKPAQNFNGYGGGYGGL